MTETERAIFFNVAGDSLLGVVHHSASEPSRPLGVLIVVGGPQYRVGSHRQFVLIARFLAAHGIPVMRFDYRGMGDSTGIQHSFEEIEDDFEAAINAFVQTVPDVRGIVVWGLCDAASAALLFAWRHSLVKGLVLLNPWVRTEQGLAKAYLKHYYLRRFFQRDFWQSLLRGRVDFMASSRFLVDLAAKTLGGIWLDFLESVRVRATDYSATRQHRDHGVLPDRRDIPLPVRMASGLCRYDGPILVILSGSDLTAAEFRETVRTEPAWDSLLDRPLVTLKEIPEANHTFSRRDWRDQVAFWTLEWIERIP